VQAKGLQENARHCNRAQSISPELSFCEQNRSQLLVYFAGITSGSPFL
jgi:hypothetical protein